MVGDGYKRSFDLFVVMFSLAALFPLWVPAVAAIALAIRLHDGGAVIYRQTRLGWGGVEFTLLKFRTMAKDAERRTGPVWARTGDPRCTPVGRLLRRYHLDELPQLVNVLRGDMSLVGPRPERPELAASITRARPEFARRLAARPGLAGLAQAYGPARITPRQKLRYDLLYIRAMSPWLDAKVLAACLWRALGGTRARRARRRRHGRRARRATAARVGLRRPYA